MKKIWIVGALALVIGVSGAGVYFMRDKDMSEVVTKETVVERGNLVLGVTESGNASLGSLEQTFSISSTSSSSSSSGSSSSGSSTEKMSTAIMGNNSGSVSTTSTSSSDSSSSSVELEVEKVYAAVGQVVKKGDAILKLTKSSISGSRKILKENISNAKLLLQSAKLERKTTLVSAKYSYQQNLTTGKNAESDYNNTLSSLENAVTQAQEQVTSAKKRMAAIPEEIAALEKEQKSAASSTSENQTSSTTTNTQDMSQNNTEANKTSVSSTSSNNSVSSIENQIAALEEELENLEKNYSNLVNKVSEAKAAQTEGKITAKEKYDQAVLNYENAKKIYNIAVNGLDDDVEDAEDELKEAKQTLKAFNSFVGSGTVTADYNGTILELGYSEGDILNESTAIVAYSDMSAVTIVVSVSQEDIRNIAVGNTVNIEFTAYEDETFRGTISSIDVSKTSGSSTVSYDVTILVSGNVGKIYEGMTANVTFVTSEVEDVLYVSRKAIQTEDEKTYVKVVKDGVTQKVEVTTGLSNGIYVEIQEGLSENDVVLIESQVNNS